jgi:NAD(P)-dependent dehydrogenase (short-subunit alcohol dehydrogenase family)
MIIFGIGANQRTIGSKILPITRFTPKISPAIAPNPAPSVKPQAIQKLGGAAIYVKADVRRETDLQNLIRQTIHQWGRLDVLCNNAGIQRIASVDKTSFALWDEVMTVNARGPFFAVKVACPICGKREVVSSTSLLPLV